jgi:ribosome-associated heat shock protein Hsp15
LAQSLIERGKVRLNRQKVDKASTVVKKGDVLTLTLGPSVRTVEIRGIGERRGPAPEAQRLYAELMLETREGARPPQREQPGGAVAVQRPAGTGRPTKKDRRLIDKLKKSLGSL